MKNRLILFLGIFLLPFFDYSEMTTGFHLSIGQLHYSFQNYANTDNSTIESDLRDLFIGFSFYFKNKMEIDIVYNRATGEINQDPFLINYDKDGFGLEAGKVISINLFKKSKFTFFTDFVAGVYVMIYPILKIQVKDKSFGEIPYGEEKFQYQVGFYWTIRLKTFFTEKASIDLGFKSLIPFKSNEFESSLGEGIFLSKNFLYIGMSF